MDSWRRYDCILFFYIMSVLNNMTYTAWNWDKAMVSGPVPIARRGHSASVIGRYIFVFGGIYGYSKVMHCFLCCSDLFQSYYFLNSICRIYGFLIPRICLGNNCLYKERSLLAGLGILPRLSGSSLLSLEARLGETTFTRMHLLWTQVDINFEFGDSLW